MQQETMTTGQELIVATVKDRRINTAKNMGTDALALNKLHR